MVCLKATKLKAGAPSLEALHCRFQPEIRSENAEGKISKHASECLLKEIVILSSLHGGVVETTMVMMKSG